MRTRIFVLVFSLLLAGAAIQGTAHAGPTYTLTNSGVTGWVINSTNNPTLTLIKGQTYNFAVAVSGHPLFITTEAANAGAAHFTTGVTNDNAQNSTLVFTVPQTAPATLFYQCGFHNGMSGMLTIIAAPVPATGYVAIATLAGLVLLAGAVALRRRARA